MYDHLKLGLVKKSHLHIHPKSYTHYDVNFEATVSLREKFQFTIDFFIDEKQLNSIFNIIAKDYASEAKIPGFRPGKVPFSVITKEYKGDILNLIYNQLIENIINKIESLFEIEIDGKYNIKIEKYSLEDGLLFKTSNKLCPQIIEPNYNDLKLENYEIIVSEEEINQEIDLLYKKLKKFEPLKKDRKTILGDLLIINTTCKIEGEDFSGGKLDMQPVEIGSNSFIPGFEDQLINKSKNEKFDINVTFPSDYHEASLCAKKAVFSCEILNIEQPVTESREEFLSRIVQDTDTKKTLELIKESIVNRKNASLNDIKRLKLFDQLMNITKDFEYDEILLNDEINRIRTMKLEANTSEEDIKKIAHRRVKLGYLLSHHAIKNDIKVLEKDIIDYVSNLTSGMDEHKSKKMWDTIRNNPESINSIVGVITEAKSVQSILDKIEKESKNVKLDNEKYLELIASADNYK